MSGSRTPGSRQPSPAEEEGGAGARNGDAAAFPLLPPHALPQPLHHLPHLQHPQVPPLAHHTSIRHISHYICTTDGPVVLILLGNYTDSVMSIADRLNILFGGRSELNSEPYIFKTQIYHPSQPTMNIKVKEVMLFITLNV